MRKFKIDKESSKKFIKENGKKLSIILMAAGALSIGTGTILQVSKNNNKNEISNVYEIGEDTVTLTSKNISSLFPEMNDETIDDATLVLLLDLLAKEDENGKISADDISKYKSRIDSDVMMSSFNSLLDVLEDKMIKENRLISISNALPKEESNDIAILSNIEAATSTIIYLTQNNGSKDQIISEYNKIYALFVKEDEITINGQKFKVRDLSYANRAVAQAYARTVGYFVRNYVGEKSLDKLDDRTNNQNNKAYIKTKLEILSNQMNETSEENVSEIFDNKYASVSDLLENRVSLSKSSIKNLVDYSNLKYLSSDKVATKDKKSILVEYTDEKVENAIESIDAIYAYGLKNQNDLILFSDLLLDTYKNTQSGKTDKIALDFVQYNSIMLLNTAKNQKNVTIYNNPYFENIYKYFTKQNFVHKYKDENGKVVEAKVVWQDISDSTNFVAYEIINQTLSKLGKVDYIDSYITKSNENLEESIQYIQNTVTGECGKVESEEFVKVK